MSNERSTQFEYFAEMQARELMSIQGTAEYRTEEEVKQDLISILARQAYDFAVHVLASSRGNHLEDWQVQELLSSVPDMAELPPVEEKSGYFLCSLTAPHSSPNGIIELSREMHSFEYNLLKRSLFPKNNEY